MSKKIHSQDSNSDIEWKMDDMYDAFRDAAEDYKKVMKELDNENSISESEGS